MDLLQVAIDKRTRELLPAAPRESYLLSVSAWVTGRLASLFQVLVQKVLGIDTKILFMNTEFKENLGGKGLTDSFRPGYPVPRGCGDRPLQGTGFLCAAGKPSRSAGFEMMVAEVMSLRPR